MSGRLLYSLTNIMFRTVCAVYSTALLVNTKYLVIGNSAINVEKEVFGRMFS